MGTHEYLCINGLMQTAAESVPVLLFVELNHCEQQKTAQSHLSI